MVDSIKKPPKSVRTAPPWRGAISVRPSNHESTSGPCVIASHTSSGLASTVTSAQTSNGWAISALLRLVLGSGSDARVDGHDQPVVAAAGGGRVVVLGDQRRDRVRQLLGERGPGGRRGEPHARL